MTGFHTTSNLKDLVDGAGASKVATTMSRRGPRMDAVRGSARTLWS